MVSQSLVVAAASLLALTAGPISVYARRSSDTVLSASEERRLLRQGPAQVGLFQAIHKERSEPQPIIFQATGKGGSEEPELPDDLPNYKAHCFMQPIDHFDPSNNKTFCQRYWFADHHYQTGGPIVVLDGGETSGANRLPYLHTGIVEILTNATNGLGVILEHRYYGKSMPVPTLSTDNLRWLNNAQALEDSARFIAHVKFAAVGNNSAPWIYYGGSYAGARAAHMRVLYPDLVFGAIASSAVTHAQVYYPEYMQAVYDWAPRSCMDTLASLITVIDTILDITALAPYLKALFGLSELEDADFASVLSSPLGGWQGRNWDPEVGTESFYHFCDALLGDNGQEDGEGKVGFMKVPAALLRYAEWIKTEEITTCPNWEEPGAIEACFSTQDATKFQDTSINQGMWRSWLFQVCTEWGYFQGSPLEGPRIISNRVNLEYTSKICTQAYPPGKHFTVPATPNVTVVNALGDFDIAYDRLAFIDGDSDPWRPATPQKFYPEKMREDTTLRPSKIIQDAVHHYDENGLAIPHKEPKRIQKIHQEEIAFVKAWLKDWKA